VLPDVSGVHRPWAQPSRAVLSGERQAGGQVPDLAFSPAQNLVTIHLL
jgi:hypothetical protein